MMNLRLIIPFCFFLLIVCPLTASAACPSDDSAEVISKVHNYTYEWTWQANKPNPLYEKACVPPQGIDPLFVDATKENSMPFIDGKAEINELPQCQPVGELPRECVDHEVISTTHILHPSANYIHIIGCAMNFFF